MIQKEYILENAVINSIKEHLDFQSIDKNTDTLLVALSGGADSVCLLRCLNMLGYQILAAHVNYRLRGKDSKDDESFCKNLCVELHIPIHILSIDAKAEKEIRKGSTQEIAREIRYDWFTDLLSTSGCNHLLTAHHLNDSIETFFINFLRGTGVNGLKGISSSKQRVIRPLLKISKAEIMKFMQRNKFSYRQDKSNESDTYFRNKIRHQLGPVLENLNPSYEKIVRKNLEKIDDFISLNQHWFENWKLKNVWVDNGIQFVEKTILQKFNSPTLLHLWLSPYAYNYEMCIEINSNLTIQSGKVFLSKTHELLVDRSTIQVRKQDLGRHVEVKLKISEKTIMTPYGELFIQDNPEYDSSKVLDSNKIIIDKTQIQGTLIVRNWQKGDRFQPSGMQGKHKKVSDLLTELKFSKFQKEHVLLLVNNDIIIWVIGIRKSVSVVSPNIKHSLKLNWLPKL